VRIALDSNRYPDLCAGHRPVVEVIEQASEVHVPLVVLAEQRAAFAHGKNREKNERGLTKQSSGVRSRS